MIRLIFAFCYTYTGNYKYRNIYINLEHLLFTNNANNDVNRYKIYLFWYVNTQFKATVDDGGILVCILTNEADNNNFIQVSSF